MNRRIVLYVIALWPWLWLAPLTPAQIAQAQTLKVKARISVAVTYRDSTLALRERCWYQALLEEISLNGVVYHRLRMNCTSDNWTDIYNSGTCKAYNLDDPLHIIIKGRVSYVTTTDVMTLEVFRDVYGRVTKVYWKITDSTGTILRKSKYTNNYSLCENPAVVLLD